MTLQLLGPTETDNSAINGVVDNTVKHMTSKKALNVRFCRLRDGINQGQFHMQRHSGKNDL